MVASQNERTSRCPGAVASEIRERRPTQTAQSALRNGRRNCAVLTPGAARPRTQLICHRRSGHLTGRDEAGRSVFKSFEATPKVVEIDFDPGLTFYELYMTDGVPRLTGLEPDPMLTGDKRFPGPGGTMFRLISYPPKRPQRLEAAAWSYLRQRSARALGEGSWHGRPFRTRCPRNAYLGHYRLWDRHSWRDDAGIGRRTEGSSASR